jgi:hypothetical protein
MSAIVSRCVLLQAVYELIIEEQPSIEALAYHIERRYPTCFVQNSTMNHLNVLDIKALNKRLRSSKDKVHALGRLSALDTCLLLAEITATSSSSSFVATLQTQSLCVLVGTKGQACLGLKRASGLTPSSGTHGGRVGRGVASTYALRERPYTGVSTMDPELALVMANLAQIQAHDVVWDPFAGSAGNLLACAHFGMGNDGDRHTVATYFLCILDFYRLHLAYT